MDATSTSKTCAFVLRWAICGRLHMERMPYSVLAIPLRVATATVFWNSAMVKLNDWDATLFLFQNEYTLPIISPVVAAHLALGVELTAPIMLALGLLTRVAAVVLIGMTAVIQTLDYPMAWPTHIQWFAMLMLLILLFRGPGSLSLDRALSRLLCGARRLD